MNALRRLFSFNGGVKPLTHKSDSTQQPIACLPLASELVVPLHQSIGGTPRPLVVAGQLVLKGERIGAADGNVSAAVHAPTSGRVTAVEPRQMPHTSGLSALCVVIESDGEDRWATLEPVPYRSLPADELRDILRDAGVVGLGGAVYPSHLKLRPGRKVAARTLVLNGAECEPYITCDDMLMRERAADILRGARIMRHMLGAEEVLVGIEDNKPEAVAAMRAAAAGIDDMHVEVIAVPTRYPAGGAKQLIRVLTGIEVPHGERSTDYGVQCFNVGTAFAVHEAIELGRPLVSRIVTVAGNVDAPRNFEVPFGTPMTHLARHAGLRTGTTHFIMGGPMMGFRMPSFDVPVVKATNCVIAATPTLFAPPMPEQPCIRCGDCARACPADLQPFELYWHARSKNFGKAQEYHLFDCIECGCCSYVCPSHIPLVDYFRFGKSEIWAREQQKTEADSARERFEWRNARLDREKQEKAERLAARAAGAPRTEAATATAATAASTDDDAKKALIAAAMARAQQRSTAIADAPAPAPTEAAPASHDTKKALIAAALARAQAQQVAAAPRNTENLTPAQQAQIDAADTRRAAAPATTEKEPDR